MGQRTTEQMPAGGTHSRSDESDLQRDEIFDLMSNHRRRYAIHYCKQTDGPVSLSDLAEQVAAWEYEKDVAELTADERKTVYTSLQQTHLPRLDRAGVVTFENGDVELTEQVEQLDIYLDIVPEGSIPWGMYYLGLSVIASLVIAALWADLLPTDSIPMLAYPTLLVALFAVSAAYHAVLNRRYRFENLDQPP